MISNIVNGGSLIKIRYASAENTAQVNIVGTTTIVTINLGDVALNDLILVSTMVEINASGSMTNTFRQIFKSAGTATLAFFHDNPNAGSRQSSPDGFFNEGVVSVMVTVTTAGTLTLGTRVTSNGTSPLVVAGDGQIHAVVIRG